MAGQIGSEVLGASPTFVSVISNNPDGNTLMRALCDGPMARYGAIGAGLHVVDDQRRTLRLWGYHGFTERITHFERIPVEWDFPVTRVLNSGEAEFAAGADLDRDFPLLSPARSLLSEVVDDAALIGVTLVALPIFYAGVLTAVCSVVARHDRAWSWPDLTHLNGTCAAISLWQRIAELDRRESTFGSAGSRRRAVAVTDRQRAIIELVREGKSNASIAKALGFSIGTIKAEIQALLTMLSATNRSEMVERADRAGITRKSPTGT